ncbi:MAG TPA: trans-aconitate 2-methyltransferase [Rhodoblastus sp.]|nr:trans-aconitate 2-methyltransferase [Rhodoblastus sp.]
MNAGDGRRPAAHGDWNPALYLKFEGERTRAVRDLLAQTPLSNPGFVYDLGCGPGNSTELLRRRFPSAELIGVDTSEAMLAHARERVPDARFLRDSVDGFRPDHAPDLIFANSVLQFTPDHQELFANLTSFLPQGGCLAVQMPDTAREAAHALMRMIAVDGPWRERLMPVVKSRAVIADAQDYYDWLRPHCARLELWRTTYVHPLDGAQGVVDWFAGSALRPFLNPLTEKERESFLASYRREIIKEYAPRDDGVILLPYPRLFIVAVR